MLIRSVRRSVCTGPGPHMTACQSVLGTTANPAFQAGDVWRSFGQVESEGTAPLAADRCQGLCICRFFTRVSGWGPGQLESECAAGVWFTAAASAGLVLDTGLDGAELWHKVRMPRLLLLGASCCRPVLHDGLLNSAFVIRYMAAVAASQLCPYPRVCKGREGAAGGNSMIVPRRADL